MILVALDLEMNQPSGRVIQVGTALLDTGSLECSRGLSLIVNPGEPVSPSISKLTGITQEIINSKGVHLLEAQNSLEAWVETAGGYINPLTWGGADPEVLKRQVSDLGGTTSPWVFGRRWIDAKTVFVTLMLARGAKTAGGLARSMTKLGLRFEGRKHNAADDAYNTARVYAELLKVVRGNHEEEQREIVGQGSQVIEETSQAEAGVRTEAEV